MRLKDLPIHAMVRDFKSNMIFRVADEKNPYYNGVILLADRLIGVGCFDAKEPDAPMRMPKTFYNVQAFGNNDYAKSNIHQWLNSSADDWYAPTHEYDKPPKIGYLKYDDYPYDSKPGFLSRFSEKFREALIENEVPCVRRIDYRQAELTHVKAKAFLPSRTELGKGDEWGIAEGRMLPIFNDPFILKAKPSDEDMEKYGRSWNYMGPGNPHGAPHVYHPKLGWWFFLRTANIQYEFLARVMSPYGALTYTYVYNDCVGIRPIVCLDQELEVTGDGAFDEIFTIAED